jgi:LmbE family N-acetylglucosaminyl deacetylase
MIRKMFGKLLSGTTALALVLCLAALPVAAQRATKDPNGRTLPDALEAIQKARMATRVLFITAHPDDEASGTLTYLARQMGDDVALLTLTRGEGGQNAIGPEQGAQLGIIRSTELLAATQTYGVKLFFTRAPDFGFSKTMEETLNIWGDRALGDIVRVLRTYHPDVVVNGWGGQRTGHGNHQASGFLTPKAIEAAADPKAYPEQLAEGLRPWKVGLVLQQSRGGFNAGPNAAPSTNPNAVALPVNDISPIWGQTYNEISRDGFISQRSQGVVAFGFTSLANSILRRPAMLVRADGAAFDKAALTLSLGSLPARFPAFADLLKQPLLETDLALERARVAAQSLDWPRSVHELALAGRTIAELESKIAARGGDQAADAEYELARTRGRIDHALACAGDIRIQAETDRTNLVAGETFKVTMIQAHRDGIAGAEFAASTLVLPEGWKSVPGADNKEENSTFQVSIPIGAQTPHGPADWMLPFTAPLVEGRVHATIEGYGFDTDGEVLAVRTTPTAVFIESLRLVPAIGFTISPRQFVMAVNAAPKPVEVLALAHAYSSAGGHTTVGLDVPTGWRVSAPQEIELAGGGDSLLRFTVTPPERISAGDYEIKAWARRGNETFRTSLTPLPSLPSRLWSEPAVVPVHAFNINIPANLRVGYVAADIDPVPEALGRLGVQVELLDQAALIFGDLHKFDAIIVGIRAYELRSDVMANNQRLLDYSNSGGTLVLEYERDNFWNNANRPAITPYPASMQGGTLRITDEHSPVRFLAPDSPLLNFPNKITQEDFKGWVQERANYLWSSFDSHYQAVLAMNDPGEAELNGSLVWTRYGKGVYIYAALEFFRQLPEGNPGAYRLFVNLLSQSRAR